MFLLIILSVRSIILYDLLVNTEFEVDYFLIDVLFDPSFRFLLFYCIKKFLVSFFDQKGKKL